MRTGQLERLSAFTCAALTWGLFALVCALGTGLVFGSMLNQDVGFFLLGARILESGGRLYRDFHDFNMPSNYWLPGLALHLAEWTGHLPAHTMRAVLLTTLGGCAAFAGVLLRRFCGRRTILGILAPSLFATATIIQPGQDFGQREALFVASLAPLMIVLWARHREYPVGALLSVGVSLLATIGASQKPHFLPFLAAIGGLEILLRRGLARVAPEIWLTGALSACHLAWVVLAHPDFVWSALPRASATYGALAKPMSEVLIDLLTADHAVPLTMLAVAAGILARRAVTIPRDVALAWPILTLLGVVLFLSQRQGFWYHLLVYEMTLGIAIGLAIAAWAQAVEWPRRGGRRAFLRGLFAILPIILLVVFGIRSRPDYLKEPLASGDPVVRMMRELPPGAPVLSLQTGVPPFSPLHAYADVRPKGPIATLLALRPIVDDRNAASETGTARKPTLVAEEEAIRTGVLAALGSPAPRLVLVDVSQPLRWFDDFARPFSIVGFFEEDAHFRALWAAYESKGVHRTVFGITVEVFALRSSSPPTSR